MQESDEHVLGDSSSAPRTNDRVSLRLATPKRWPLYLGAAGLVLYTLVFFRGLGWQWQTVLTGATAGPVVSTAPPPAPRAATGAAQAPAPAAAAPRAKTPLPPTDEPAPRNTTDKYGVFYDAHGVAVMGIDTDPGGVYNVPAGRQVRIGGPDGALFDVQPGGKITPATRVRE